LTDSIDFKTMFPYIRCINLDQRPDRWTRLQTRFAEHDIGKVERFSAIDGNSQKIPDTWIQSKGAYGCLSSHIEIVREAQAKRHQYVLIFEDDVVLAADFIQQFNRYIAEVPDDWDMLFLGGLHQTSPQTVTKNIVKLTNTYCTHAYALHQRLFEHFIEINQRHCAPVDVNNFKLQEQFNCYCFHPPLAWVEDGYSDIAGRQCNWWWLRYGFAMRGEQINRILNETLLVFPFKASHRDDPHTKALLYILTLYGQMLQGVRIVIVEQKGHAVLASTTLPPGAHHLLVNHTGPMDRGRCFTAAVTHLGEDKRVLCCLDSKIVLLNWDFRACLMLCDDYDLVIPYENLVDLHAGDIDKLMANNTYPDLSCYSFSPNSEPDTGYLFFTRTGYEQWRHQEGQPDLSQWIRNSQNYRGFYAPGEALSLKSMTIGLDQTSHIN
jgi:glycosyl transferase family 25